MPVNTPETAPEGERKEEQPKQQPKKLQENVQKPGNDGGSLEVTPEQRKRILDQHYAEQNVHGHRETFWHRADEALKPSVGMAGHVAAAVANPVAYGGIRLGDLALKNTVGKVPYLGELYNKPRSAILGIGTITRNAVSAAITSPLVVPDKVRDIGQAISGRPKKEGRGWLDSATEAVATKSVSAVKWTFEKAMALLRVGAEATEGLAKGAGRIVAAPFQLGYKLGSGVQSHVPLAKHVHGGALGLPVAVLAGVGVGGIAASFLGPAASTAYWSAVSQIGSSAWGAIKSGFAALKTSF